MAKLWEEFGRKREHATAPETEMEDAGGHELDMCEEVSWEEVVAVCLKIGKAIDPDEITKDVDVQG